MADTYSWPHGIQHERSAPAAPATPERDWSQSRPPRPTNPRDVIAPEALPMTGEDVMVSRSETEQLRQQLLQAQRLSSVGALASSVAHEFNNILTTIINY